MKNRYSRVDHWKMKQKTEWADSHAGNMVVLVASDVEPGARVHQIGIPALQHVIRVRQAPPQRVERVPFRIPGNSPCKCHYHHRNHQPWKTTSSCCHSFSNQLARPDPTADYRLALWSWAFEFFDLFSYEAVDILQKKKNKTRREKEREKGKWRIDFGNGEWEKKSFWWNKNLSSLPVLPFPYIYAQHFFKLIFIFIYLFKKNTKLCFG